MRHIESPTRQQFLRMVAGSVAAVSVFGQESGPAIAGKRPMIVHNDFPEDLETPLDAFGTWLTPNDAFFVRQHLPRPTVDMKAWRLEVGGLVAKPLSLSLQEV